MLRRWSVLVAALLLQACFEDSIPPEGEGEGGGSANATTNGGGTATSAADGTTTSSATAADETGTETGEPIPDCDPTEEPDSSQGVFVRRTGADTGAGNAVSPLATIGAALEMARSTGRSMVFAGPGVYSENVILTSTESGITIEGGWLPGDSTWTRDCADTRRESTIIEGLDPQQPTIDVTDSALMVGLRTLTVDTVPTVETKGLDSSGASLLAIRVAGVAASLELDEVDVRSGDASDGVGGERPPALGHVPCDTLDGCVNGGSAGAAGSDGAHSSGGLFEWYGYEPGDGDMGQPGTAGTPGTPGSPGQTLTSVCYEQCVGTPPGCGFTPFSNLSGHHGECGCGGMGGSGGRSGRGGGASTAVLVSGDGAQVTITNARLIAGDGGNGSIGSEGGEGLGSPGVSGAPRNCETQTTCEPNGGACVPMGNGSATASGGAAGGDGLPGGEGGAGGHGSGGPSCPLVVLADLGASVTTADVELVPGAMGVGPGDAPDGVCPSLPR